MNKLSANQKRILAGVAAVILAVICGNLWKSWHAKDNPAPEKIRIVCMTYPVYLFTRNVMKDSPVQPELILPPDVGCPHDYALTPGDLRKLSKGWIMLLQNGLGLDDQLVQAAVHANPNIIVTDLSANVPAIPEKDDDDDDHDDHGKADHDGDGHEREGHHHHHSSGMNPHLFASPASVKKIVDNIRYGVIKADPVHADLYRANAERYKERLTELENDVKATGALVRGKRAVIQHSVFSYLCRDLEMADPVILSENPEEAPTVQQIKKVAEQIRKESIPVIFTEPQYPEATANLISRETSCPVVKLDPVATGPADAPCDHYESVMRNNLKRIRTAFGK